MQLRSASGAEMMIAHDLWAHALWPTFKTVKIVDDYLSIENMAWLVDHYGFEPSAGPLPEQWDCRCAFVCDDRSPLRFIFCPKDAGIAAWAHEFGHAACDTLYPESRKWGDEQLEAFALLANANVGKRMDLEPAERNDFARHTKACRCSPAYREALRWAWSLRKLPLKQQMARIADGRSEAPRAPAQDQVSQLDAEAGVEF